MVVKLLKCLFDESNMETNVWFLSFHPAVEQLPTITVQTAGPVIALPFEGSFSMRCEAKGNPQPVWVRWLRFILGSPCFLPLCLWIVHTISINPMLIVASQAKYHNCNQALQNVSLPQQIQMDKRWPGHRSPLRLGGQKREKQWEFCDS